MTVRLSALRAGHPLLQGILPVVISVTGCVDRRVMVKLEGLGKLKEIQLRNRDSNPRPSGL
jgi:hypothetical protein